MQISNQNFIHTSSFQKNNGWFDENKIENNSFGWKIALADAQKWATNQKKFFSCFKL